MATHSLSRAERLRSLGAIRRLFDRGESGFVYPLRYIWFAEAAEVASTEVLFSVPKRFLKRANKRNLCRRRVKEAYRLNKKLPEERMVALDVALIYSTKEIVPYQVIENAVRKILAQIGERL